MYFVALGGTAMALGVIGVLLKVLLERAFAQQDSALRQTLEKEMVKFSSLHEKRVALYNDVYNKMLNAFGLLRIYSRSMSDKAQPGHDFVTSTVNGVNAKQANTVFCAAVAGGKLFLPADVFDEAMELFHVLKDANERAGTASLSPSELHGIDAKVKRLEVSLQKLVNHGAD